MLLLLPMAGIDLGLLVVPLQLYTLKSQNQNFGVDALFLPLQIA